MSVLHFISSFESTYKRHKIQLPFHLFLVILDQQISFFTKFQNFIQPYLKKYFRHMFSFVNRFFEVAKITTCKEMGNDANHNHVAIYIL